MTTLLKAPVQEAETVALPHDDVTVLRKANGNPPNRGRSKPRWLKVTGQTITTERGDFELTHWKKVWRSMQDE